MALINIGTTPNDGTGDNIRAAFGKINSALDVTSGMIRARPLGLTDIIAIGTGALGVLVSPSQYGSIGIGASAGGAQTSGDNNTIVGHFALANNITGSNATAFGLMALRFSTVGNSTAVGAFAGYATTTGFGIVAIGGAALQSNTTGYDNVGVGTNAGFKITVGANNTMVGCRAMYSSLSGLSNTAVGTEALYQGINDNQVVDGGFSGAGLTNWILGTGWSDLSNGLANKNADGVGTLSTINAYIDYGTGGSYTITYDVTNWTVGTVTCSFGGVSDTPRSANGTYVFTFVATVFPSSLTFTPSNTARLAIDNVSFVGNNVASASYATAIGVGALYHLSTGLDNTALGVGAARQMTVGQLNTAIGSESLARNGSGSCNTGVGKSSLQLGNAGSNNAALGYAAGFYETGSNKIFLDTLLRTDEASARTAAPFYAVTNVTPSAQTVALNAAVTATYGLTIPSGADLVLGLNYGIVVNGSRVAAFSGTGMVTPASVAGGAGFRLPHGTLPTSPIDGDLWSTTAGLFIRINGVTKTVTLT